MGLGSGKFGPDMASIDARDPRRLARRKQIAPRLPKRKPLPQTGIEGGDSGTTLRIDPDAVGSAVVGKVAIRRGEADSGGGLGPS